MKKREKKRIPVLWGTVLVMILLLAYWCFTSIIAKAIFAVMLGVVLGKLDWAEVKNYTTGRKHGRGRGRKNS